MNIKKILTFILYLLPWFIGALLFPTDKFYYTNLDKPFFAPPPIIFGIIWPILYLLITISIYKVLNKSNNNYKASLIVNYISNQLFSLFFFTLKNNSLALIDTIIVLISSIYLYRETKKIDNKSTKYLIPYILWNIFATILITSIFIMN